MEAGQGDLEVEVLGVAVLAAASVAEEEVLAEVAEVVLAAAEVQETGRMKINNDSLGPGQ